MRNRGKVDHSPSKRNVVRTNDKNTTEKPSTAKERQNENVIVSLFQFNNLLNCWCLQSQMDKPPVQIKRRERKMRIAAKFTKKNVEVNS